MSQIVMTKKEVSKRFSTFGWPLFICGLFVSIFSIALRILDIYFNDLLEGLDFHLIYYSGLIILFVIFLGIFFMVGKELDLEISENYLKRPSNLLKILKYTSIAIGIHLITTSIISLFSFIFSSKSMGLSFINNYSTPILIFTNIIYIIFMIFIKPIFDEYVFRGVILRSLSIFGRVFASISASILYAIFQGNIQLAVPAFFLGLFLSYVSLKYHSLKITIFIQVLVSLYFYVISILPNYLFLFIPLSVVFIYIIIAFVIFENHSKISLSYNFSKDNLVYKLLFSNTSILVQIILFVIMNIITIFKLV